MDTEKLQPTNKILLWVELHRKNMLLTVKIITAFLGIIMLVQATLGLATFSSFINQESIQQGGFTWSMPMMNKEFELALATLELEEPHYRDNAKAIMRCWDIRAIINPVRLYMNMRRAMVEFSRVSLRKINRDKAFLKHMIRKEKLELYQAKLNHEVYR